MKTKKQEKLLKVYKTLKATLITSNEVSEIWGGARNAKVDEIVNEVNNVIIELEKDEPNQDSIDSILLNLVHNVLPDELPKYDEGAKVSNYFADNPGNVISLFKCPNCGATNWRNINDETTRCNTCLEPIEII